jgi:hypothetical protein
MAQLLQESDWRCEKRRQPLKDLMFIPETSKCAFCVEIKLLAREISDVM